MGESMEIHGRNGGGWRTSWYRAGTGRWLFIVWPYELLDADGNYPTEHPLFRNDGKRHDPHHTEILNSKRECEAAAEAWIAEHAGRAA